MDQLTTIHDAFANDFRRWIAEVHGNGAQYHLLRQDEFLTKLVAAKHLPGTHRGLLEELIASGSGNWADPATRHAIIAHYATVAPPQFHGDPGNGWLPEGRYQVFPFFTANTLAKLNEGDAFPDLSPMFPEHFSQHFGPVLQRKFAAYANDLRLYRGDRFTHNVQEQESRVDGWVGRLVGPMHEMRTWLRELNAFEESFGMVGEYRTLPCPNELGIIRAKLFYLPSVAAIGDRDGALTPA